MGVGFAVLGCYGGTHTAVHWGMIKFKYHGDLLELI